MSALKQSSDEVQRQLAEAYERGRQMAFAKHAGYGDAAILGGLVGGALGGPIGGRYGEYVAGESPHYRDVLRKKLLFQVLGTLSGALVGAGAAVGARSLMEHTGKLHA